MAMIRLFSGIIHKAQLCHVHVVIRFKKIFDTVTAEGVNN